MNREFQITDLSNYNKYFKEHLKTYRQNLFKLQEYFKYNLLKKKS
jgi:hypothetical protein